MDPTEPRKLIFATNIAESSLTIDGVIAVLDGGNARVPSHDPWSGLPKLELAPISRASAEQRAGRAGRTRDGFCLRLYSKADLDRRRAHEKAEISRLDLASTLLQLTALGVDDLDAFPWFEAPPSHAVSAGFDLLRRLGALEEKEGNRKVSALGRRMLRYPLHPRLARLMVEAEDRGITRLASAIAALLSERPMRHPPDRPLPHHDADPLAEWSLLEEQPSLAPGVLRVRKQLASIAGRNERKEDDARQNVASGREERERELCLALLCAYPDRVAMLKTEGDGKRAVFSGGGSATLSRQSVVQDATWVVGLRVEERSEGTHRRQWLRYTAAIDPDWLIDLFPECIEEKEILAFDPQSERGDRSLRAALRQAAPRLPASHQAASRGLRSLGRGSPRSGLRTLL